MSAIMETFSNRLRILRIEKGLNQENLAKILGLSVSGYAKIERGETKVSLTRVEQIAQVLKIDISTLLELNNQFVFNNNGTTSTANVGHNSVVYHQFDQTIIEGLMTRLSNYESELNELKGKIKK